MKIVTYNINGIRASIKLNLKYWIKEFDADIYCFQEVRANSEIADNLLFDNKTQLNIFENISDNNMINQYYPIYNCGDVAGYAGTLILSKIKPDKILYDMGEYWQDNEGRTTTIILKNLAVVNCYVPNGNSRLDFKLKYIEALKKYVQYLQQNYHVVCVGDFNIAHNEIDLTHPKECKNKSVFLPIERQVFNELLNLGLVDSFRYKQPNTIKYSWRSYRSRLDSNYNSWKYRIDYILIDKRICDNLEFADILELSCSDHLPCYVKLIWS